MPHLPTPSVDDKHASLCIRLAECAVYLRPLAVDTDSSHDTETPGTPGILRGLLILNLGKPMKISSIEATLKGKSLITWLEGVPPGLRKYDTSETSTFFEVSTTFFKATSPVRRANSISPERGVPCGMETPRPRGRERGSSSRVCEESPILSPDSSPSISSSRSPSLDTRGRKRTRKANIAMDLRNSLTSLLTPKSRPSHPPLYDAIHRPGYWTASSSRTRFFKMPTVEEEREGHSYKEFGPGTYTFPISVSIPADQPGSVKAPHGVIWWDLKATVHRPGTFTNKMSSKRRIRIVRNPQDDETMIRNSTTIYEKQWDNQLKYMFSFSNRLVYIGGSIPLQITLFPLDKIKIFKISARIVETTKYQNKTERIVREEVRKINLLSIDSGGTSRPILPIESDDIDAFKNSRLYAAIASSNDVSSDDNDIYGLASSFSGPGPWTIKAQLRIPDDCDVVQPSSTIKKGGITASHQLTFLLRVERGDETPIERHPQNGKHPSYDIRITVPIEILSCRCNPHWTGLPPYTDPLNAADAEAAAGLCPCSITHRGYRVRPRESQALGWEILSPLQEDNSNNSSRLVARDIDAKTRNILYRSSAQFERLMSGVESVMGECPPSYAENHS